MGKGMGGGKRGGGWKIAVQRAGTEDDENMIPVLDCTEGYIEVFGRKVALRGANGDFTWLMGTGNQPDRMVDPTGRFVTIQQGDGNFVTYDAQKGPIGSSDAAVWSAWFGKVISTDPQPAAAEVPPEPADVPWAPDSSPDVSRYSWRS